MDVDVQWAAVNINIIAPRLDPSRGNSCFLTLTASCGSRSCLTGGPITPDSAVVVTLSSPLLRAGPQLPSFYKDTGADI